MSPQRLEQIAQLKNQIKMFGAMQYVMPLLMLFFALCVARGFSQVSPGVKQTMIFLLCVFAAADFGLIRFMLLPQARKKLEELQGGSDGSV